MSTTFVIDRNRPSPVYHQISQRLRERIVNGELPAGTRLPTGQDLSKQYGVAYRTIIKSLELLKKEGLLVGVPSRGTFVRGQASKIVRNIAVTVDQMYHHAIASHLDLFQRAVNSSCMEYGFHLQLFSLPRGAIFDQAEPTLLSTLLRERHVDGLITYHGPPVEDITKLARMNVPVVTNRNMYPGTGVPWVMEDVADAARNLVRLLVGGLGHRHIRLIMARPFDPSAGLIRPSAILANALIQELHGVGIDLRPSDIVYSEYFWDKTAPAVRQWLTADRKPTAIISCDDNLAMKTLELAGELGLRVPQDLSVTTYGDIMPQSTLTAIHLPIRKIADQCVSILNQMLAGEKPQVAEFPAELIIRQTCGPANP